ncbi:MAG: hypothetical protein HYS23_01550 [Geobacter sp.]|nr:hypothetical protein [Geobacter sp.]
MKGLFTLVLVIGLLSTLNGCMAMMHGDHMGHHAPSDDDNSHDADEQNGGHSH